MDHPRGRPRIVARRVTPLDALEALFESRRPPRIARASEHLGSAFLGRGNKEHVPIDIVKAPIRGGQRILISLE